MVLDNMAFPQSSRTPKSDQEISYLYENSVMKPLTSYTNLKKESILKNALERKNRKSSHSIKVFVCRDLHRTQPLVGCFKLHMIALWLSVNSVWIFISFPHGVCLLHQTEMVSPLLCTGINILISFIHIYLCIYTFLMELKLTEFHTRTHTYTSTHMCIYTCIVIYIKQIYAIVLFVFVVVLWMFFSVECNAIYLSYFSSN